MIVQIIFVFSAIVNIGFSKTYCPPIDGEDSIYFPVPDCTKFCQCSNGVAYQHDCPLGLHFNAVLNVCDWPENAGCSYDNLNSTTASTDTGNSCSVYDTSNDGSNICVEENIVCPSVDGDDSVYFPVSDCTKFCQCSNGDAYEHNCPDGLHFNPVLNVCDWPENAGCDGGSTNATTTTTTSTTTTQEPCPDNDTTTDTPNICVKENIVCPSVDGDDSVYFPVSDCTKFCQCSNGDAYEHNCPDGLHFNPVLNVCDWPENAGCDGGSTNATTTTTKASTTSTSTTTTQKPCPDDETSTDTPNICVKENIVCPSVDGDDSVYFAVSDCTKFCQCSNGAAYEHNCPVGLHFNPVLNVCDWPENAGCAGGSTNATTTTTKATTTSTSTTPTQKPRPEDETSTDTPNICVKENIVCPSVDGDDSVYFPVSDCTKFCQCSNGDAYEHNCPVGLHFNPVLNVCDWPEDAGCAIVPT